MMSMDSNIAVSPWLGPTPREVTCHVPSRLKSLLLSPPTCKRKNVKESHNFVSYQYQNHALLNLALDKNLKANANSKNPKITLVVFSHPPRIYIFSYYSS